MKRKDDHSQDAYLYMTRSIDGGNMYIPVVNSTIQRISSTSTNLLDYMFIGGEYDDYPGQYVPSGVRTTVVCGHCRSEMGDNNTCEHCGGGIRLRIRVREEIE